MNLVKKVPVVVCDHEGQLFIDKLLDPGAAAVPSDLPASHDAVQFSSDPTNIHRRRARHSAEMQAVFSQLGLIRKQNNDLQTELEIMRTLLSKKMKHLSDAVNRMAIMPARVTRNVVNFNLNESTNPVDPSLVDFSTGAGSEGESDVNATLCRNPWSLYTLWHEYEFGIGGRIPAKTFTSRQRGKNRYNYSKRKVFWDLVSEMVRRGYTANDAIDKIYTCYGFKTSVSNIIKNLQRDRKAGYRQFF